MSVSRVARSEWHPGVVFALFISFFLLLGLIVGSLGVLWADIVPALGISLGVFGTAQLVSPLVSVVVLLFGASLSAWGGKKRLGLMAIALEGGAVLALAVAGGLAGLVVGLVIAGAANGLMEISVNGGTLDWERATGRHAMNYMHAGYSGGAVLGALGAGLLRGWGWGYQQVLILLAMFAAIVFLATLPTRFPPTLDGREKSHPADTIKILFSGRVMMTLALIAIIGPLAETVANVYSVIYLRGLGAAVVVGGLAFALFNAAMFLGRIGNASLVQRYGARFSLLASAVLLVIANGLLLIPGGVPLAVVAFMVLGVAVAGVVPTVLSAADQAMPNRSGAVAGAMMAACYTSFVIWSPVIGWIAELFSLQAALLTVGVSGLALFALAWTLKGHVR
ncbi:MAG: MFS transporter [Anaerolineae bacterium]|nr:MFS transporter [Anaerolineae bacterium]